jgi:hypothetical protein
MYVAGFGKKARLQAGLIEQKCELFASHAILSTARADFSMGYVRA